MFSRGLLRSFKCVLILIFITLITLITLIYKLVYYQYQTFSISDPSRTDLLKLKYQYEEKQTLTTLLTKYSNKTNNCKDKKIYLRNMDFCLYFSQCIKNMSNTYTPPDCPFKCTFVKKNHDKIKANILRTKFGFDGQVFDDRIEHNWTLEPVPNDMWSIFSSVESPNPDYVNIYNRLDFSREKDVLINYWRGADFWWPYFTWTYYNPEIRMKKQKKDYWSGKSKLAAIFVSNCGGQYLYNNRTGFLKKLKEHMEVDVYGVCGPLKCKKSNECDDMLRKDYFFYLAFENANCRDYITEKFYRAVVNDVVPVVLGAHPDDYRDLVPNASYIHVEDFQNLQDLATFLTKLSQDPELYNRYFEWRDTGYFQFHLKYYQSKSKSNLPCKLCTWLHNMDTMGTRPVRNLPLFQEWSNINLKKDLCLPRNQWFWNPHQRLLGF